MIRKIILLIFLLPTLCFAGSIQDMHKAAIARKNAAVANGTMGELTQNTSSAINQGYWYHNDFEPATPGAVNYIHAYMSGTNGKTVCLSLHSSDGTELASQSGDAGTDDAGWLNLQLDSEVIIVDSTTYYISVRAVDAQVTLYRNDAVGKQSYYDTETATCGDAIGNPTEMQYYSDDLTVYVNNTAGDPS